MDLMLLRQVVEQIQVAPIDLEDGEDDERSDQCKQECRVNNGGIGHGVVRLRLILLASLEHHLVELAALAASGVECHKIGRKYFVRFELRGGIFASGKGRLHCTVGAADL